DKRDDVFTRLHIRMSSVAPDGECGIDPRGRLGCAECPSCPEARASLAFAGGGFVEATSLFEPRDRGNLVCARTKQGSVSCFQAFAGGERTSGLAPIAVAGV